MSDSKQSFALAIIGAGGISGAHAGAVKESDGRLSIAAVVDPNAEAADKLASDHDAAAFDSAEALFEAIDSKQVTIDGIIICTPPTVRVEPIREALHRGIAVLTEKPVAINAEDAARVTEIADAHPDTLFGVAYCHRFAPPVIRMKQLVAEGRIGRLSRFENAFAFHHPPMSEKWMSDPATSGGGSFIDTGCHSLDLFRYLVGPARVVGSVFDSDWEGRGESSATVLVKASEGTHAGVAGVILAGWLEPERFTIDLIGTDGSMHYDYMKPTELVCRPGTGEAEIIEVETHEVRFARQLEHFAAAATGRSPRGDLADARDGFGAAEAVDSAAKSAKVI
ncbi:MAG: Gfo/Idh/MocA family oxidoreductase [Planctomycetota bacterium]